MDNAFRYIKDNGIESEADYPYQAKQGKCHFDKTKVVAKCTGYIDIPSGDEEALKQAVATQGPVSVAIGMSLFKVILIVDFKMFFFSKRRN
jgi:cathepsin L